ncbi:hypothetical protein Plim_4058 [Planctopirus limnophila DSM 3776]|uniref:Uncharacterized protein n=1 Tax=Planctopirus limnophila (strain ATCC 43296 / DSM 3776 / IFAM 1008 / Mu 290) TaxID=521674 RepID=D5SY76_PLAL2|nr:hypothetical protein Plim_4058 [Planctopirus limnophila DSM 3776]
MQNLFLQFTKRSKLIPKISVNPNRRSGVFKPEGVLPRSWLLHNITILPLSSAPTQPDSPHLATRPV